MDLLKGILDHAKSECPRESCGLVVLCRGKERYIPCRNVASVRHLEFVISPDDYAKAEDLGEIIKVVHSHPTTKPIPSKTDLVSIEAYSIPWIIVNPQTEEWTETRPSGIKIPLVGREYSYGVLDCYTLVRDFYREDLHITLSDYPRRGTQESDVANYLNNLEAEGFVKVDHPIEGDLVLFTFDSLGPTHAAIYVGGNKILHHPRNRLSSRDIYNKYWQKNTYGFYRHTSRLDIAKAM